MANTYLTRTSGTATNVNKYTFSAWIKRSLLTSSFQPIFGGTGSTLANYHDSLFFNNSTDKFIYQGATSGSTEVNLQTSASYRDVSAWYHVVVAYDSTQITASNRVKIYINGVQETSFSTETYPAQNRGTYANGRDSSTITISKIQSDAVYFDGAMSHIHFIDGTAYDASAFGSTDATTGEWEAKTSPSVTYGNNGFFILKDGNGITDQSGEGNDFTLGGGTLTDLKDNPDNVFATLNPLSPQSYTFSNGNNTIARAGGTGQTTAIGTLAVNSGKWYWELKLNSGQSDYPRVGIYEMNSDNHIYTTHLGNASNGTGKWWGSGGTSSSNKKIGDGNSSTIEFYPYDNGDILMFALDCDNEKIWFGKNGTWYTNNNSTTTTGTAISNNTATPAFSTVSNSKLWIPAVFGNAGADNWSINFGNGYFGTTAVTTNSGNGYSGAEGSSKFNYTVPTGYSALSTKGLNE